MKCEFVRKGRRMARLTPLCALSLLLVLSGCADTHKGLMDETVAAMTEAATALEWVKDEATAKAAIPAMETFASRLQKIGDRRVALTSKSPPTEEETKLIAEIDEKQVSEVRGRLDQNLHRIRGIPDAQSALHAALEKVAEAARHRGRGVSIGMAAMSPPPGMAIAGIRPPTPPPGAFESLEKRFGKDKVATIVVRKVPAGKFKEVVDRVQSAAGTKNNRASGNGDTTTVTLAPVDDLEALSSSIDFGTVVNVDPGQRRITIEADPSRF